MECRSRGRSRFAVASRRGCRTNAACFIEARFAANDLLQPFVGGRENASYEVALRLGGGRPTLCDSLRRKQQPCWGIRHRGRGVKLKGASRPAPFALLP